MNRYIGNPLATPCTHILFDLSGKMCAESKFVGWAEANIFGGFVFFFCAYTLSDLSDRYWHSFSGFITPILYVRIKCIIHKWCTSIKHINSSPIHGLLNICRQCLFIPNSTWIPQDLRSSRILSRTSYDNTGGTYDVTRILTPESTIDLEAYHSYSPLFLS